VFSSKVLRTGKKTKEGRNVQVDFKKQTAGKQKLLSERTEYSYPVSGFSSTPDI